MSDQSSLEEKDREKLLFNFKMQMARVLISIIALFISNIFVYTTSQDASFLDESFLTAITIFFLVPVLLWSYQSLHELFLAIDIYTAIKEFRQTNIKNIQVAAKGTNK